MDYYLFRCGWFRILPLLCLFLGIQTVQADIIQGRVLDAETHEPLYGAHVEVTEEVPDLCTVKWVRYTDSLGCFTYSCCGGSRLTFRARFLGYKTSVVRMKGTDAGDTIHIDNILLQPSEVLLKEVIGNPELPVVFNLNIGHAMPRCIMPFGVEATVDAEKQVIRFAEEWQAASNQDERQGGAE